MVAPTRTPQARGVKCDLCKKILASATWLDQTKLAKEVDEPQAVLNLINQHNANDCPCIPKNIEYLLVGSTHFEIHRLVAKKLDAQVHRKQYDYFVEIRQKILNDSMKNQNDLINDCHDTKTSSRFKIYAGYCDLKHCERSKLQLRHLTNAVDYWRLAMEDQINPFNSKLALRLGLTHHVIYACYLFKYYKTLDYQLIASNLLLNLFRSIDGVTANAILHANYLLIKALIDCGQLSLARHHLKQATRSTNYHDKSHYESILLTCAACELNILEGVTDDIYQNLEELAELAVVRPDDKLQHYYARTLAISLILRYIHCYPSKSDQCFEFFHTFRYVCAIIRRCYENSFELVLAEKDLSKQQQQLPRGSDSKGINQILEHSWIRFAVSDFVFNTFDLLTDFYVRAGLPESLELLYNGLNLVAFRTGSCYWQSRIISIGARLDLLCSKYEHAQTKLDILARITGYTSHPFLMNLMRLETEVSLLSLMNHQESVINKSVILDLLQRITGTLDALAERLAQIELYDCKSDTTTRLVNELRASTLTVPGSCLGRLSLRALDVGVASLLRKEHIDEAKELLIDFGQKLGCEGHKTLEYYDCQMLSEITTRFADIQRSEKILLDALSGSRLFLETGDSVSDITSQLSSITLNSEPDKTMPPPRTRKRAASSRGGSGGAAGDDKSCKSNKASRIPLGRRSRRGKYNVTAEPQESLGNGHTVRKLDCFEAITNIASLTKEEIVVNYLRNSEPNPDYLLYRRSHELMLAFRLLDERPNREQLLYHFSESNSANTIRYRWMMFEEQQISPFDRPKLPLSTTVSDASSACSSLKHLGFCNSLNNSENVIKSFTRTVPDDYKLVQFKYILDEKSSKEHLLNVSFDHTNEPVFVHAHQYCQTSDEFFEDAKRTIGKENAEPLTLLDRLHGQVEKSKRTLLSSFSQRSRSEARRRIESEIGIILHDIENDLLGPFRYLLCGKVCDPTYRKFVTNLLEALITTTMQNHFCRSVVALESLIENAPLITRNEFCQVIGTLFNCSSEAKEVRDCFNKWLKGIEAHILEHGPSGATKTSFLQSLSRSQMGLILDSKLELLPFESLPVARLMRQGIFRVPSLRLFSVIASRNGNGVLPVKVNSSNVAYVLDPANNLSRTRERFESKLRKRNDWLGVTGQAPKFDQLEQWLATRQIYIFIGHGAGTVYYNKLCKGKGLSAMQHVHCMSIVMGCSSGRVMAEGPNLESFGIAWMFVLRGAPSYIGLLWDVTDSDIDRFLDSMLSRLMPSEWPQPESLNTTDGNKSICQLDAGQQPVTLAEATAWARHVCQHKFLVGSTPVVYGLPVWCKT